MRHWLVCVRHAKPKLAAQMGIPTMALSYTPEQTANFPSQKLVVEVVESLDLSSLEQAYSGRGSAAYPAAVLLSLLIVAY